MKSLRSDESGTALVEAAIVFPFFFFVVMAVLEFGNLFAQAILAEKATEVGVRFAVTSDIVATGVSDCGVATSQPPGTPCRLVPGSDAWSRSCTAGAAGCSATALNAVVARMQAVYARIAPENVVVEYTGTGLGFVGRGTPVPNVTVRLRDMEFSFVVLGAIVRGLFGGVAGDVIALPAFSSTLSGEDLHS
jgi:hypothetical protein